MAKIRKENSEEIPRPKKDIVVEKPMFKTTLEAMVKKKPPVPEKKSKK